jgi:hypothetical protein
MKNFSYLIENIPHNKFITLNLYSIVMELISIVILFLAGIGGGVMTGLISASTVTFMAGILIVFLNFSTYNAIGLSLLTDVSASLSSAYIYKRASNINIKGALLIGVFATTFAFIGSIIARIIPDLALGDGLGIVVLITGMAFLRNPMNRKDTWILNFFKDKKILASILIGIFVGLFCGIFGVGGGVTILVALVFILGYPIKKAIGTSVLIMAFIALSGGVGHFVGRSFPITELIITSIGGIFGAIVSSKYANKVSEEKMFRISGIILIILSLVIIFRKFFVISGLHFFGF